MPRPTPLQQVNHQPPRNQLREPAPLPDGTPDLHESGPHPRKQRPRQEYADERHVLREQS